MIAICAIFKNESRYLREWIEFHYRQGFDTFYLYNNDSEDDYLLELNKVKNEIPKANIKLYRIRSEKKQSYYFNQSPQHKAYVNCLKRCKNEKWIAFIDLDEYIICIPSQKIDLFLNQFETPDVAGIGVNWILYGSNGQKKYSNKPIIERFTRRDSVVNPHIKTIIRPGVCDFNVASPHEFRPEGNFRIVNERKETINTSILPPNLISAEKIRINHYFTKSLEEFEQKISRGRADSPHRRTMPEFKAHDKNDIEDFSAIKSFKENRKVSKIKKDIKITPYTAICGNYNKPRIDIKVFSDLESDKFKNPNLNAKIYKVLSHKFISSKYSIWMDGNIYLNADPERIVKEFLKDNDLAVFRHPHRNCIYKEYSEAKKCIPEADYFLIDDQIGDYKKEGMPKNFGLSENGFIIRKNNDIVREFNERWWAEVCRYTNRDQMSLPYVLWKMKGKIKVRFIEGDIRKNRYINFINRI